jgi:hypothetical protein
VEILHPMVNDSDVSDGNAAVVVFFFLKKKRNIKIVIFNINKLK